MKNGLYKIHFDGPKDCGNGVITLRDNIIHGGDSSFYYFGKYTVVKNVITANVNMDRHSGGQASIIETDKATFTLNGPVVNQGLTVLKGVTNKVPVKVSLKLLVEI